MSFQNWSQLIKYFQQMMLTYKNHPLLFSGILPLSTETIQSKTEVKDHCIYHEVIKNVTFRGGLDAGLFTPHGEVTTCQECANNCCREKHCDAIFIVDDLCYTVYCKNKVSCIPMRVSDLKTATSLAFIVRRNNPPLVGKLTSYLFIFSFSLTFHCSRRHNQNTEGAIRMVTNFCFWCKTYHRNILSIIETNVFID